MSEHSLSLLNVYDVESEGTIRHLICFLDPVLAAAGELNGRSIVGEFTPNEDDEFDNDNFKLNPEFVEAFIEYMNDETSRSPELVREAQEYPSGSLYIIDSRDQTDPSDEPPAANVIGSYSVDEEGRIAPDSFQYNSNHLWFDASHGASGVFHDRRFYNWLHSITEPE